MTRTLVFDGPRAAKRFELLWLSLLNGGDGKGDRSPVTIRKEARLQTLLDTISESVEGPGDPPLRKLAGEAATIAVPQEDFDLLVTYAEKTGWTPRVAREVVDLWDWLSAAPRKDTP
ncbi:MAG TPA: hypothetical protein VMS54_08070 [Vicinamibacterales bacterium]|nr:hypothetical protein [Vicinamibacterales bacterium]